jgi:hypothetical protein
MLATYGGPILGPNGSVPLHGSVKITSMRCAMLPMTQGSGRIRPRRFPATEHLTTLSSCQRPSNRILEPVVFRRFIARGYGFHNK